MAAGLGLLRLEPRSFWSMSPKELEAAMRAIAGPGVGDGPPQREAMQALMTRFPDTQERI